MKKIKLSTLKPNPNNPREITEKGLSDLRNSIKEFEEMMFLRPIIVDENNMILGGNMRYQGLILLGYKEIPASWVTQAKGLTEEQKQEFIIKDNVSYGRWNWDDIANGWETAKLKSWGLEIPGWLGEFLPDDDDDDDGENAGDTAQDKPKGVMGNDFSALEIVMNHDSKLFVLGILNEVRKEKDLESLEDALVFIFREYQKS